MLLCLECIDTCRALPSEASWQACCQSSWRGWRGMALSQRPQQLQELLTSIPFDVTPKEDVLQLSKLFKAPTNFKELSVACRELQIPCLLHAHTHTHTHTPAPSHQLRFRFPMKSCCLAPCCPHMCLNLCLEFSFLLSVSPASGLSLALPAPSSMAPAHSAVCAGSP